MPKRALPPKTIAVPGPQLTGAQVDTLFAGISAVVDSIADTPRVRCELDLSQIRFVPPEGLSAIMLAVHVLHAKGARVSVLFPQSPEVGRYLVRMGLKSALQDVAQCRNAPRNKRRPWWSSDALLELTRIERREDVQALMDHINTQVKTILTTQLQYGAADVANFSNVISELAQNIVDHSEAIGYVAAQRYQRKDGNQGKFVLISVADLGVGLRQSLGQRYDVAAWTDSQLIVNALLPTYSRHPDRGLGLTFVRKVISDCDGSLQVRTGNTRLMLRNRAQAFSGAFFPGTHITISFSQPAA